jgi:hypothetical protein
MLNHDLTFLLADQVKEEKLLIKFIKATDLG